MWSTQHGFPGCSPSALPGGPPGHSLSFILYGQIPVQLLVSGEHLLCLVHIHSSSWIPNCGHTHTYHPRQRFRQYQMAFPGAGGQLRTWNSCSGFPALGGLHTPSYPAALKPVSWTPLACSLATLQMEEKSAKSKSILKYQKL